MALGSPSNAIPGGKGLALSRVSDEGYSLARKDRRGREAGDFLLVQDLLQSSLLDILGTCTVYNRLAGDRGAC